MLEENIIINLSMAKCNWCGREYTRGVHNWYCSEKCYQEYLASKQKSKQPSYSGQESTGQGGGGYLSFIGKIIKWIIIIFIVIFVLVDIFAE